MPRRPSRKPPPSRPIPRVAGLARLVPVLRRSLIVLRDLGIGLTLIGAVSFMPASLTRSWPEPAQRAVAIARDIRVLSLDVARDTAAGIGSWLSDGDTTALPEPDRPVADRAPGWWPPNLGSFGAPGRPDGSKPGIAVSFDAAQTTLLDSVYGDRRVTFYCGCRYDTEGWIDLEGCGLGVLVGSRRAERVEAAPVVAASQLGGARRCWREPAAFAACATEDGTLLAGLACCERVDPAFAAAHNDLHNLVPAVGAIEVARSDHAWGELRAGQRLGDCAMRFDPILRRVQPPEAVRGDIARILLYMRDTYGVRLSRQDEQLYRAWSDADPPDAPEIERNRRIRRLQGKGNRYVEDDRRF